MELDYLLFDFSGEEGGRGSFDAMASVLPERLPALLGEIGAVLRWAREAFGPASSDDDGEWSYELQAALDSGALVAIAWDETQGQVRTTPARPASRITVTLTLVGSAPFCEALSAAFPAD